MKFSLKYAVITALLIIAFLVIAAFWMGTEMREQSVQHRLGYTISISTKTPLENFTLILPVPSVNGTSELGEAMIRGEGHNVPPDWDISLVEYRGVPMLKVGTALLVPEYHAYPIPIEPGQSPERTPPPSATAYSEETPVLIPLECGIHMTVDRTIDTRSPAGREPMFYPKIPISADHEAGAEHGPAFSVPMYISYDAGQPVGIRISVAVTGNNEWWELGWRGNSYSERVTAGITGNTTGWVMAEGWPDSGGVYIVWS